MKAGIFLFLLFVCALYFILETASLPAQTSCALKSKGDANCNGIVDVVDFEIFRKEFTGVLTTKTADFNTDSNVSLTDFEIWRKTFTGTTATPTAPTTTVTQLSPTKISGNIKILCENKNFSNWTTTSPFTIGAHTDDTNPNILKVIRNCTFKNDQGHSTDKPAIVIQAADNVLIENSTFDSIRTHVPGNGVHAIYIRGAQLAQNIVVKNNSFCDIGADGLQLADGGTQVKNVTIEGNDFKNGCHVPPDDVAENSVDVKGAVGPIYIRNNKIHGFRPCESPKRGGNQDCSGDPGAGMVVHDGSLSGYAHDVTVEGNEFWDNQTRGLSVSHSYNTVVKNNYFHDHPQIGIDVSSAAVNPQVSNNTFSNNGTDCVGCK